MVKLTPELINQSMQYINPCRERELDLRGYKIPQIENLGATLDQFDTIDLSDNDLRKLDGLPFLPRLQCLLLNNNRILRIGENLHEAIPNLSSLILSGNNMQELWDLDPLVRFTKLETLSLLMNPIINLPHYREYVIWKFPQLRLLDFKKIRQKDRREAQEFFRSRPGKDLLKELSRKSKQFHAMANTGSGAGGPGSTASAANTNNSNISNGGTRNYLEDREEQARIREAIRRAQSLEEIERLSQLLQNGRLPTDSELNATLTSSNFNGSMSVGEQQQNGDSKDTHPAP